MLGKFGVEVNNTLLAKVKRSARSTKAPFKTSHQKIEHIWKTQQDQRQKLSQEYSQQFLTLFQEWEGEVQKAEEREEKPAILFRQQQRVFQPSRGLWSQRSKTIK